MTMVSRDDPSGTPRELRISYYAPDRSWRAGDFVSIRPKHILTHDNSAAVIKKFRSIGAPKVYDPSQPVFALDHDIQNTSEQTLKQYREIENFATLEEFRHVLGPGVPAHHSLSLATLIAVAVSRC